jgi:hypothetical protein
LGNNALQTYSSAAWTLLDRWNAIRYNREGASPGIDRCAVLFGEV